MEVTISRFWSIDDDEGLSRASILFKRPRVDGQIANLVFDFIWANVLTPKKLMQKGNYDFTLYFDTIRSTHKFFYDSVYNTDTVKFRPAFKDRQLNGVTTKEVGYNVEVDPSAGHTDPSIKAFFSPTDDLPILLLFS
ncbi:hypothetical protein [Sphingobacterium thalpophilum]|uniref:Uncharacterized protein n=1 Tax=Sphingobacterium thalpophilum TaxID=259 RepID=A0A4U9VVH3_9SPHI|nr:hypothetical protein [Sphingobacterium thalpophilum]VTR50029.1 Uncharacterised protein [Sphingobacterium thalpophilum]